MTEWYIGLMSGTSLDAVDGLLVPFTDGRPQFQPQASRHYASRPFPPELRQQLLALNDSGADELHRAALAANALVRIYAEVVQSLLATSGLPANAISALGAHGQTVRHRPQAFDGTGYTLQLNQPALLAELTGIRVVADFRSRDVAAGGQGAPLVPAFHQAVFARPDCTTAVLNLGGIANLSVLRPDAAPQGFDCGPANALLDHWCQQHTGAAYDANGAWAASGQVLPALLEQLWSEPFLHLPPPKSTGRDLFNPAWLERHLAQLPHRARPEDIQATLVELSAKACAESVISYSNDSKNLIVCGGGAFNNYLLQRLQARLPAQQVQTSDQHGLPAQQVEAAAFAWLARQCLHSHCASLPSVTGASGARILGAVYPA